MTQKNARLIFENGQSFLGTAFGAEAEAIAEVVFNTAMVGYQEMFSDPSCCDQMVVMTYPLIGSYGLADDDYESHIPRLSALIVREYNGRPSNYRYTRTLGDVMLEHGIPGIEGVDTREITRMLRAEGSMRALLTGTDCSVEEGIERIRNTPAAHDQARRVGCKKLWYSRTPNHRYNVVAVDFGIKMSIVRRLNAKGCNVTVVPCTATAEEVRALRPDGLLLSNGPGDPADVPEAEMLAKALMGSLPMFGINLGHLVMARACGAKIYKMKFGHHGGNHPVKNLLTGRVEITSQGHIHVVDEASVANTELSVTHVNLLDGTVEGLRCDRLRLFSTQHHPESAPGPQDSDYLFDQFIAMMDQGRKEEGVCHA